MSSPWRPENVNRFKGNSGAECEDFIQKIREAAWKKGKLDDTRWMAHFASLHYSGKALKWHSALPLDVRQDWFKQEMALLERWPPPADESESEEAEAAISPAPAAASVISTQAGKSSEIGVMQFVPTSGDRESTYISKPDSEGRCTLTEVGKALCLRWDRFVDSGSGVIEWIGLGSKWLAIHWVQENPSFAQESTVWARLTVFDPDTGAPGTLTTILNPPPLGPFRINAWRLSSAGQITPIWKDGIKEVQLGVFTNRTYVYFAADPDAYEEANRTERRGRLVFRPIE